MYKLVAIDLDGTLLNSYGEVSNENKQAIKMAINKGVEIVLSSGRIGNSVESIANELGANNYYISGNGSMLYNMKEEKIEYENFISKEKMLKLIKICDENSIYYSIYTENMVITKSLKYNVVFYNYENSKKAFDKRTNINIVQNVYEYVENLKQEYYKKLENMTEDERLQYFRDNIAIENKLNFEKEINGTVYKVNTYFDENAEESILNKFFRLTKKL